MVTYAELKDAKSGAFNDAADAFKTLGDDLDDETDRLDSQREALADAWTGEDQEGGTAAADSIKVESDKLSAAKSSLDSIKAELETLAAAVAKQKEKLSEAIDKAADVPATVSDDGTVKIDWASIDTSNVNGSDLSLLRQAKQAEVDDIQTDIDDAVAKATEADETAQSNISTISVDDDVPSGGHVPAGDIPDGKPEDVKTWWDNLSDTERQYLLANHPEKIGALDGVPSVYRDIANRSVLNQEMAAIQEDLEYQSGTPRQEGPNLKQRYEGLADIQDRLNATGAEGNDARGYLLLLDNEGDGKGIVSIGNPDTADNVFTYVPGIQTTLDDAGMHIGRVDQMMYDAGQVESGGSTAGIMWLGYDAPETGAHLGAAEDAAPDLGNFQEGLRQTHEGPPSNNTIVGHSYGSTVIGVADQEVQGGLNVDQMTLVGSPGVDVDHADELTVGGENVYATHADGEIFEYYSVHGENPTVNTDIGDLSDYGANTFLSDEGGHSSYWNDGNIARDQMALIVTGNGDDVTPMDPKWE